MDNIPDRFQQGLEFQERGLFDLAIQEYNKALEADPDNLDVLINLGAAYLQKGLPEKSTQILQRALARHPDQPLALFNLGKAYLYREETDKALEVFEKARLVLPGDRDVQVSIAQCLTMLGRKSEAVELLMPLREIIASDLPIIMLLGRTLMELSRFAEAQDVFRKAVTSFPDSAESLDGLIRCQLELGIKDKAMTSLRRALMVHPGNPGFNVLMVDLLIEDGELDEAVALLKRAITTNPTDPALRKKMDELARRMPVLKKRIGQPELVQKQSPFETEVYDILEGLYDGRVSLDVAISTMKELRTKDHSDLFLADELANLLFQGKYYHEAMDLYGEIQRSAPYDVKHRINFAKCLALSGNLPVALEYLKDSMREFQADSELPLAMVELKLLERDYFEANRILEKAMLTYPNNVHGLFLQGYISLRINNLEFAAETFRKLVKQNLIDEEVTVWFSRTMILLDQADEALESWNQFQDGFQSLLEILTKIELSLAKGDSNAIKELLQQIGEYEPRFLEDHLMFGKAFFYARDLKNAEDEFDVVIKQDPSNPEALSFLAMIYLIKSKSAKFWMLWQKAIESDSFYAVLTASTLAKTLNYPQVERLKTETRKILDISIRDEIDRLRLTSLLQKFEL